MDEDGTGGTLRVLVLLMEHPDGGRTIAALSDPYFIRTHPVWWRARFEMDPSNRSWGVCGQWTALAAFRAATRESDGYVVQREYVIGSAPYPEMPQPGDPSRATTKDWSAWLLGEVGRRLGIDPARWVQGLPADGDTRINGRGRTERYTSGRWV